MNISEEVRAQLKAYVDAGDAASYYGWLGAHGHDYGNLAYQAATDTGFWGKYANNFLENKARELGVSIDRNKIMRELMEADFHLRDQNGWEPIPAKKIRDYHHEVFEDNGLTRDAWTGTFLDDRAGPAAWCIGCNNVELEGQTPKMLSLNFGKTY